MPKPRVITKCVANAYTGPDERIVEVSSNTGNGQGCLINITNMPDGSLTVDVYGISQGTEVRVSAERRS
ncbi:hypothetical protein I0C86_41210 [Plantactinospora sp. S1510]|uniref:Uncharacterized protein n=1 Tax=Plantactinospora alkalitolerans TaxID=2789879 RepID=A0ABS0H9W1_9ACTN|nr:hypothetical protein [Plantactinospora alkalitolerans]MBF9135272.1 hypothetical protein [Plantactinospora alkalitolerans]